MRHKKIFKKADNLFKSFFLIKSLIKTYIEIVNIPIYILSKSG